MKIKQLIAALQAQDPESEAHLCAGYNPEIGGWFAPAIDRVEMRPVGIYPHTQSPMLLPDDHEAYPDDEQAQAEVVVVLLPA